MPFAPVANFIDAPQQAPPPPRGPVPDPSQGPAGFQSFPQYMGAFDQARAAAVAQRNDDAQLQQMMEQTQAQNMGIDRQLKAITAARKFMATRKMTRDMQAATAAGMEPSAALVQAIAGNPEVFSANPSQMLNALVNMRSKGESGAEIPFLGRMYRPPGGGRMFQTGPRSATYVADPRTTLSPAEHISILRIRSEMLGKRLENYTLAPEERAKLEAAQEAIDTELQGYGKGEGSLSGTAIPPPPAPAANSTNQFRVTKDGKFFRVK